MRWCLVLALCFGCSVVNDPDDHRPGGDLEPIPAERFCAEVVQVLCEGHVDCCSTPTMDLESCVRDLTPKCTERIGSFLLDPRTGYDSRVAAEVRVEGFGYVATCDTELAPWAGDRMGLLRVLRGTVEPGGECTPDGWLDFAALYSCEDLGQACVSSGLGNPSFCVDLGEEGDNCRNNDDCLGSLYCEGFQAFVSEGTCMPELVNGEGCDEPTDCASGVCESMTCEPLSQESLYCALPDVFG
jgi:hypothetical protein